MASPFSPPSSSGGGASILLPAIASPIDPRATSGAVALSANTLLGVRVVMPAGGILHDLAVYVNAQAGNLDVGVYSTASPRVRLYSTGSAACPAAGAWRILGDPALSVSQGDQYDFCIANDANGFGVGRAALVATAAGQLPSAFTLGRAVGPFLAYATTVGTFPLPATLADAALTAEDVVAVIIARIV